MSAAPHLESDAVDIALRLAREMDRQADLMLSIGCVPQAERLAHLAAEMRVVAQ